MFYGYSYPSSAGTHTKFVPPLGSAYYSEGFARTRRANRQAQSSKYPAMSGPVDQGIHVEYKGASGISQ